MNSANVFNKAHALIEAGEPFVLATVVRVDRPSSARAGSKALIRADGSLIGWVGGSCAQPTVIREAARAIGDGSARLVRLCPPEELGQGPQRGVVEVVLTCVSGGTLEIYIEPVLPRPQLVAIGHLPVVEALARLGKSLDYHITLMGHDLELDRFPEADRVMDHLGFDHIEITPRSYVVIASHGNYDEEALEGRCVQMPPTLPL